MAYWRLWQVALKIKIKPVKYIANNIELAATASERSNEVSAEGLSRALSMQEAIRIASRLHFISVACLPRSLVLVSMLKQKGETNVVVKIGVAKTESGIASHAWVELNGLMVGEPESVAREFTQLGR